VPKVQQVVKEMFDGKEPHKGVNPDEVVAVGAAIQGGVLAGEVHDVLLLDVTPLSLGIETLGGIMTKLVDKNTTIPTERKQIFSTADDNQMAVTVKVYQGERQMAADNRLLGQFNLEGIPPAPRGMPQIEVKFDIDANGILSVSAKDLGTSKEQKITITASSGLSKDDVDKMVNDAKQHADEDKDRKHKIEIKNRADSMVYQTEKQLRENGATLPPEVRKPVEEGIEVLKKAIAADDTAQMESVMKDLESKMHSFAEELYRKAQAGQQQQQQGQPAANAGPAADSGGTQQKKSSSDDEVIDADFRMVDDDK